MNATARYTPDKCEVWVPTQDGEASFAALLAASGLPADKCDVYKINLGGGFGRRGAFQDYVTQAVLIAKQMPGTPVKLLWSREEDMLHGRFHPVMQCKLVGGFDANNNLTGLHMRLSGQSILAAVRPEIVEKEKGRDPLTFQGLADAGEHSFGYTVPNLLIDHAMRNTHVPPGFWRGVNINQNAIFLECFMDELAQAAGQDALEFRRKLMASIRSNLGVLNAVAERIGWGKPAPQGIHRGLAQMKAFNSYVAAAAEISVEGGNKMKIHRIVAATDPGYAVNPAQIERQVAGSFVYGLSALFDAGVHGQERPHRAGELRHLRLDAHRADAQGRVDHHAVRRRIWGGIGEPTICVAAPAVLNAFYRGDRQAHPLGPAEEPRHPAGVRGDAAARAAAAALALALAVVASGLAHGDAPAYAVAGDAIPAPLTGAKGDAARGREIIVNRQVGLCLLCHSGPFPEERFQGTSRRTSRALARACRKADQAADRRCEPGQPGDDHAGLLSHRGPDAGRARLSGQAGADRGQIEDIVAFLVTLSD